MYLYKTKLSQYKKSVVGIPSIFGVGQRTSAALIASIGVGSKYRIKHLNYTKQYLLSEAIRKRNMLISVDLRKEIQRNIQHHFDVKDYRGNRHRLGYPVRGQRTRTNARTQKKLGSRRAKYGQYRRT